MPSVKRTGVKAAEVKTGFEAYDGPVPKRGMFRAKITQFRFCEFGTGAQGFKILAELEAAPGDPKGQKEFDGYPQWSNLVFGDKEQSIARESNFYAAVGVKDDPAIVFEEGELKGSGQKVKTLGGKNVIGQYVNLDIRPSNQTGYEGTPEVDGIYKLREVAAKGKAVVVADDDESDLLEEGDAEEAEETEESGEEQTIEERLEELNEASLKELKELAATYVEDGMPEIKPVTKKNLVDKISEWEFAEPEEDEEETEEDEVEADEEEVEEEDVEEEEAEEDDERATRLEELGNLDRPALKAIIKGIDAGFKVFTKTTEADLINAIIVAEFGEDDETPF